MSADFGTCDTSGGTARHKLGNYEELLKLTRHYYTKGVRMDPRHSGVALTSTGGRRVAVDV
eukprot:5676126-Prymnesium_polylepis.1